MTKSFDPSLYLVTDPRARHGVIDTVRAAVKGGVTLVQLRDKTLPDDEFIELGRDLKAVLDPAGIPLLVNDRVDTVEAIGAAGAHIGQSDWSLAKARARLGPDAILGLSVGTAAEYDAVDWSLVDYIGTGPIYATGTKADHDPPIGFEGLAVICAPCPCPVVAIGGVKAKDAAAAKQAGASGLAVVSAITAAEDPEAATLEIANAWRQA